MCKAATPRAAMRKNRRERLPRANANADPTTTGISEPMRKGALIAFMYEIIIIFQWLVFDRA